MCPEQFIGTIEEVDTHEHDSRGDPWHTAAERWTTLSESIKMRYQDLVGQDGPDPQDLTAALHTLGSAAQQVTASLGDALKDPQTRDQIKETASALISAIGRTLGQLGEELRRPPDESEPT